MKLDALILSIRCPSAKIAALNEILPRGLCFILIPPEGLIVVYECENDSEGSKDREPEERPETVPVRSVFAVRVGDRRSVRIYDFRLTRSVFESALEHALHSENEKEGESDYDVHRLFLPVSENDERA